jgi:hypothetical protein
VRQEINRAVNELYRDHVGSQIAFEQLQIAGMRFKARRMSAYLHAANLAHLPKQLLGRGQARCARYSCKKRLLLAGMPALP